MINGIQEADLVESVEHFHRIIGSLLEADNLNDLQKGQVESINFIFESILIIAVFHAILERFFANLERR